MALRVCNLVALLVVYVIHVLRVFFLYFYVTFKLESVEKDGLASKSIVADCCLAHFLNTVVDKSIECPFSTSVSLEEYRGLVVSATNIRSFTDKLSGKNWRTIVCEFLTLFRF